MVRSLLTTSQTKESHNEKLFLKMMLPLLLAISSGVGFLSYGYSVVVSLAAATVGAASLAVNRTPYHSPERESGGASMVGKRGSPSQVAFACAPAAVVRSQHIAAAAGPKLVAVPLSGLSSGGG